MPLRWNQRWLLGGGNISWALRDEYNFTWRKREGRRLQRQGKEDMNAQRLEQGRERDRESGDPLEAESLLCGNEARKSHSCLGLLGHQASRTPWFGEGVQPSQAPPGTCM